MEVGRRKLGYTEHAPRAWNSQRLFRVKYTEEMARSIPEDLFDGRGLGRIIIRNHNPRRDAMYRHSLAKKVGNHIRGAFIGDAVAYNNTAVIGITHHDRNKVVAVFVCVMRRVEPEIVLAVPL